MSAHPSTASSAATPSSAGPPTAPSVGVEAKGPPAAAPAAPAALPKAPNGAAPAGSGHEQEKKPTAAKAAAAAGGQGAPGAAGAAKAKGKRKKSEMDMLTDAEEQQLIAHFPLLRETDPSPANTRFMARLLLRDKKRKANLPYFNLEQSVMNMNANMTKSLSVYFPEYYKSSSKPAAPSAVPAAPAAAHSSASQQVSIAAPPSAAAPAAASSPVKKHSAAARVATPVDTDPPAQSRPLPVPSPSAPSLTTAKSTSPAPAPAPAAQPTPPVSSPSLGKEPARLASSPAKEPMVVDPPPSPVPKPAPTPPPPVVPPPALAPAVEPRKVAPAPAIAYMKPSAQVPPAKLPPTVTAKPPPTVTAKPPPLPMAVSESPRTGRSEDDMAAAPHPSQCFRDLMSGEASARELYSPLVSKFSLRTLKPFIRRDFETVPPKLALLQELHKVFRQRGIGSDVSDKGEDSIDYCYLRPQYLQAVNDLLRSEFWPNIDGEWVDLPEYSVVVLYHRLVIGCSFISAEGYISYLAVHPQWRSSGIARFMIYHLIMACPNKDITLHVSANNSAMILYQHFGFKPEQFIRDFYDKYLPPDSKMCRHAFQLRLRR